jgi:hypothetical protein
MMPKLTAFQLRCEKALLELLERHCIQLSSREVVSNGEASIHVVVDSKDLEVWIYDDEAEYSFGRKSRNYEAAVIRDETERVTLFIKHIQAELGF